MDRLAVGSTTCHQLATRNSGMDSDQVVKPASGSALRALIVEGPGAVIARASSVRTSTRIKV